jgi:hypothetical protein
MNKLIRNHYHALIIWLEIVMFGLVLFTLWLDEFIDLPHRLFNASPTPYRLEEYIIETASVFIMGGATIFLTLLLLKRLERAEEFVRVCSWCKRVFLNNSWVDFEVYLLQKQELSSSHGICESCAQKVQTEIAAINKQG